MKNLTFSSQTESEKQKKLDVVLRQLTEDRLTSEQRRQISKALGGRRQYNLLLSESPVLPREAKECGCVIRPIFGSLNGPKQGPTAVLVYNKASGEPCNNVYIYLPEEEQQNDARNEKTGS